MGFGKKVTSCLNETPLCTDFFSSSLERLLLVERDSRREEQVLKPVVILC